MMMHCDGKLPVWAWVCIGVLVVCTVVLACLLAAHRRDETKLILFYVTWCPHCTSLLRDTWPKLETVYGSRVQKVDCDVYPDLARQHGVQAYPTIMRTGGLETYRGERTFESLSRLFA